MTARYGVKVFLSVATLAAFVLFGALPATAATCTDRYVTEEGTLVIYQGGAFYDSVTGEAVCLPFKTGKTVQRPLSDFLDRQATFCFPDGSGGCLIFIPGIPNFLDWRDAGRNRTAVVDYAGLVSGFGTVVTGSVTETRQKDGRALVRVGLDASNAFNWVVSGNDTATSSVIFGNRLDAVQVGAEPALGSSSFRIEFFNSAMGAPLLDLVELLTFGGGTNSPTLRSRTFTSDALGELHAAFGVVEGTPGEATVTMLNLQMNGPGPTVPVENIMVEIVP